ncbi:MAG: hypothetical protein WAW39_17680 [Prosthecobacter sp.]|uniref:ATP-binding protein n=1 Tax=Prosthecobacter sp. TaxID=1965333 RepID=UPI003BB1D010
MKAQLERLASSYQTLISLFSGMMAVVVLFSDSVKNLIEASSLIPEDIRPYAKWVVIGLLLIVGVLTLLQALARRSVLVIKERFQISPHDPAHLVGRETDLTSLADECAHASTSLVFLTGESGAGKSALVRAGLIPYLQGNVYWTQPPKSLPPPPDLFPILLDGAAIVDWKQGIEKALRRVLLMAAEDCTKLGIPAYVGTQSPFEWLRNVGDTSCQRVMLIMDQMDDYIVMHREHLFSNGKVVSSDQVVNGNEQWKALAELVCGHQICLLLICRADTSVYLEAFRFIDPEKPVIFRLHQEILSPLLDSITQVPEGSPPVIIDPVHGWLQLRARLLKDLADGASEILPIRLVVALSSLRTFRFLTSGEYQKAGRAPGLERLHIVDVMRRAAKASLLSEESLLLMLQSLISADASKTQRRTLQEMAASAKVEVNPLKIALQFFENEHLIRRIPGDEEGDSFMLYHDQLARGIRDAARARDHWNVLLQERAKAHADAIGWVDRWRTLIPLREQVVLLWQRLRGRLIYGMQGGYAVLSTCRLLPAIATIGILTLGAVELQRTSLERQAERVVGELVSQVGGQYAEVQFVQGWRAFAALPSAARLHGLKFILGNSFIKQAFTDKHEQLAHVVLGLDPSASQSSKAADILQYAPDHSAALAAKVAVVLPWDSVHRYQLARGLIVRICKLKTGANDMEVLCETFGKLVAQLPKGDVEMKIWAADLAELMCNPETDGADLPSLGKALGSLAIHLSEGDEEVEKGAAALVEFMINPVLHKSFSPPLGYPPLGYGIPPPPAGYADPYAPSANESLLSPHVEALNTLVARLPKGNARVTKWAATLVDHMCKPETDSEILSSLGQALRALMVRLPRGDQMVKRGAAALFDHLIKLESDRDDERDSLRTSLKMLAAWLPDSDDDVKKWAGILAERMCATPQADCDDVLLFGDLLGALAARLNENDLEVKKGGDALFELIIKTDNNSTMEHYEALTNPSYEMVLGSLIARLPNNDEQCEKWAQRLIERICNPKTGRHSLSTFGKVLSALAAKLPKGSAEVEKAMVALVQYLIDDPNYTASSNKPSPGFGVHFSKPLSMLVTLLPKGNLEVKKSACALAEGMLKPETPEYLRVSLGEGLASLIAKLPEGDEDVKKWAASLAKLAGMVNAEDTTYEIFIDVMGPLADMGYLSASKAEMLAAFFWRSIQARASSVTISRWCQFERCAAQTDQLGKELRVQAYLELLKHPMCIGDGQAEVIHGLEKVVNESFSLSGSETSDVREVVKWVKKMNGKGWHLNLRRDPE